MDRGAPEIYIRTLPEGLVVLRLPYPQHLSQVPPGDERLEALYRYEESLRAGLDIENYFVDVGEVEAAIKAAR